MNHQVVKFGVMIILECCKGKESKVKESKVKEDICSLKGGLVINVQS